MPYYTRHTQRAQRYDYGSPGTYFITICTKDRIQRLADIIDGKALLKPAWKIIDTHINNLSHHRTKFDMHGYIIMPNHIHLLFVIDENNNICRDGNSGRPSYNDEYTNEWYRTHQIASLQQDRSIQPQWPESWSCGYIMNLFKWWCTREINKNIHDWILELPFGDTFARQPRYHDHIIRDESEYEKIKWYITTNPAKRHEDKFYT